MILLRPKVKMLHLCEGDYPAMLGIVANAISLCYGKPSPQLFVDKEKSIRARIKAGHESVIEHVGFSVMFTVNRGVTHEIVRHRLASYTQSSTRYIMQADDVEFIIPQWLYGEVPEGTYTETTCPKDFDENDLSDAARTWIDAMLEAEDRYHDLLRMGWEPEKARGVLPNDTAAKIMVTANMREWRHIFRLRALGTTGRPHPQMQEVMVPLLQEAENAFPVFFEDL